MVASPHYERLKVFMEAARANKDLDAWDKDHDKALKGISDAIDHLRVYRNNHGFTGATGDAMNQWVDASIRRIEWYREKYAYSYKGYETGRQLMATALSEAEKLSPDLLDANTAAMRDDLLVSVPSSEPGTGIRFMGKLYTTGSAYVAAVEEQANEQREAAAKRIIDMVNDRTLTISDIMKGQITGESGKEDTNLEKYEDEEKSKNPGGGGGTQGGGGGTQGGGGGTQGGGGAGGGDWGYGKGDDFGRAADRSPSSPNYPGGFDQPWWSEADAAAARNRIISSGAVPTQEPAYGEAGSRTNPITDPQDLMGRDLLHTRVNGTAYRNGVVGGHTPAPPADMDHPLWRLNGGAAADASTAGRLGGAGVLGAGALGMRGAARMGSGGLGAGMRGMTGGLGGAGASALKVGSYSGSGFGSYNPPAGANGLAGSGAGASGATGVAGSTGANGGAAGAAGAAGKGGSGSGFMGAGAGAGAGAGKQDKKGRKRQYVAFKFEDDEDDLPVGYVNPMSQTYGSDATITPAKSADDGWDPRQW